MKIVRPYMRMISNGGVVRVSSATPVPWWDEPLQFVNWCGRISHRSEDAEKQDVERFLRSVVIDHGDWSITEHTSVSVDAVVDRGITHEIVRHRLAAYTQESTRFVNYAKKMPPSFIYPVVGIECDYCLTNGCDEMSYHRTDKEGWIYEHAIAGGTEHGGTQFRCLYNGNWMQSIFEAENAYKRLIQVGWRPQEARSVFPNALASRIVITMNLRMWRHFFLMRTSAEAHPQMRQVTIPLLVQFQKSIPVLYEDIEPNGKQSENLKKGR